MVHYIAVRAVIESGYIMEDFIRTEFFMPPTYAVCENVQPVKRDIRKKKPCKVLFEEDDKYTLRTLLEWQK